MLQYQSLTITNNDILHQIKLDCKIPEIVKQIITRKVITDAATEAGIKIETEELQAAADEMRLMNKLINAEDTWAWLNKNGLSIDDFEAIIYNNLLSTKLAIHLFAEKIESYFFERQLDYVGAVIYEVILDDEDLADELFYAIQEGETNFYDVARLHIQNVELQRKRGYRGIMHRQDLKPEISAAVFAAKTPEVLKPIVTSLGVHLILVDEIVKAELDDELAYQIGMDLFSQWLKQKIEQIDFELVIQ